VAVAGSHRRNRNVVFADTTTALTLCTKDTLRAVAKPENHHVSLRFMVAESSQLGALRQDTAAFNGSNDVPLVAANGVADESTDVARRFIAELRILSNDHVTRQVLQLNRKQQLVNAELLLYLSELDCRKLYRNHACPSLFEYLTTRLGQSEDVAYRWMWGARLIRTFPLVYELLADGRLHLSALMLLKPHLTEENHRDWLMAASGRSKREIEKLVASRCPKADVPTRVRKLPEPAANQRDDSGRRTFAEDSCAPVIRAPMATPSVTPTQPTAIAAQPLLQKPLSRSFDMPSRATKVLSLSEHSYRVVFTASQRLKEKLERASELVSHTITPTDLPALIERALDLLIEREERRRYGSPRHSTATGAEVAAIPARDDDKPMAKPAALGSPDSTTRLSPETGCLDLSDFNKTTSDADAELPPRSSRRVPARVRRKVWERDEGQCTYLDAEGRRCKCRHRLEFDHRVAYALGGAPTVDNIRLRCTAHNALAAEQVFGSERIASAIAAAREHRRRPGAKAHRSVS
jgi:hypothetical protein